MSEELPNSYLFRQNAINHLNARDEFHTELKIIRPAEWIWIVMSVLLLSGMFLWCFWGVVTISINAQGIVFSAEKIAEVDRLMDQMAKEQINKVAILKDLFDKKRTLFAKHYITLDELLKAKQEYLNAKESLSNPDHFISLSDVLSDQAINNPNAILDALVFVNARQGKRISAGMEVNLLPSAQSIYESGYRHGTVMSISDYPVSKKIAYAYLGNMNLVDDFFINGAPFMVKIRIQKTKQRVDLNIQPGAVITAKIIYKKCAPVKFLIRD